MAYKDKDKQREANRLAQARFKAKGITKGITSEGITDGVLPGAKVVWESEPGAAKKIKELIVGSTEMSGERGSVSISPSSSPKRGKAIKCFADLPPDVQQTIDTLSDDKVEHKRRTAIAIEFHRHSLGLESLNYLKGVANGQA